MSIEELFNQTKDPNVMSKWGSIIGEYVEKLDVENYCKLYDEIYETIYGEVLSDDKATKLVQAMKPYGEHWTIEESSNVVGGKFAPATKYYVMNMMYNDYHNMFEDDTQTYIKLADLWLNDVDSADGDVKTYRYATKV